jgi:hypothetical protein
VEFFSSQCDKSCICELQAVPNAITYQGPTPLEQSRLSGSDTESRYQYDETIRKVFMVIHQGVFDYVMKDFEAIFDQTWSTNIKSCTGSSSSSSGSTGTSLNLLDSNTTETSTKKGKRVRGDPDEDKTSQGGKDDSKKFRRDLPATVFRRLACPYFKRDHRRFGTGTAYHVCAGEGFKDLGKLK